ncbi:unnamed protein product [Somion occarium]|uniref:AAA+ ATPase domain-containing protein n=1 Tax=Somion occarium TaxID=3059160 RepID=A0ABP1DGQ1_9APHY
MQTRSSTRSSVLGKRHAESTAKCDVADEYSPLTPEASPNPKRIKTSSSALDDGSNKENIPPLRGQVLNGSPSRTRSLRRTSTEGSVASVRNTPRRHASMSSLVTTPRTPATALSRPSLITPPSTPSTLQSVAAKCRALLRATCNNASSIAGRDAERDEIIKFLQPFLQTGVSSDIAGDQHSVLYISGSPGTGKTALVNDVLRTMAADLADDSVNLFTVNCMALGNVEALWATLIQALQGGKVKPNKGRINKDTSRQTLEHLLSTRQSKCILFLDELDHIGSSAQALSALFSMIHEHSSFIRLIGIANTHTLTSSSSNTLAAGFTEHVKTLHFTPYTSQQLNAILQARLEPLFTSEVVANSEDPKKFLSPATLNLLAKKIASQTGDVRALFEVLRGAIDIAVSAGSSSLSASTPPVTPSHILDALKAYAPAAKVSRVVEAEPAKSGNTKVVDNETTSKIRNLGLQARVVFVALVLGSKRQEQGLSLSGGASTARTQHSKRSPSPSTSGNMDVGQLHTYYSTILARSESGLFTPVSRSEFGDLLGVLETNGLVTISANSRGGSKLPTTPTKSGRRGLARSGSASFTLGSGGSQEVRLAESVRMEDAIRGLGIDEKKGDDDVREEEVRAIWGKERVKISKEAKALAASSVSEAKMFEEAMED